MRGASRGGRGWGPSPPTCPKGSGNIPSGNCPPKHQGCHSICTEHRPPEPPTCGQPPPHPGGCVSPTRGGTHRNTRGSVPTSPCVPVPCAGLASQRVTPRHFLCGNLLYFFYFFFSQQKTPLILGWLKGFFFQQAFRCFFFFFLFSAFLSCRGKMKQFSLLGSCFLLQLGPAPQRGGRERGPEMLLPHCRVFGASSKQGGQYPGVPGCMCSEGDSLMSSKCCANVLPWVFLPPSNFACRRGPYARGDRPYAQADPPPNQAGGTPLAPGGLQGIPPPPPRQLGPGSPPSGFIGNGTARKRPALLPG